MKKLLLITSITLLGALVSPLQTFAATTTPSPVDNVVKEKLDQQINQLKDKIASRVSELNLVEKRGVIGTVTDVKTNQITLTDQGGNTRFVDIDEITKFSSAASKTYGISDVTKGSQISVLGIYNKQSKRILARFVKAYVHPTIYSGAIAAIDVKNFRLTIMTDQQKEVKVDVDTSTKLNSYAVDAGLVRYGFSKVVVGDRVMIAGFPDKTDATVLAASRVIDYLGLPKDPSIVISSTTASAAAQTVTPTAATKLR